MLWFTPASFTAVGAGNGSSFDQAVSSNEKKALTAKNFEFFPSVHFQPRTVLFLEAVSVLAIESYPSPFYPSETYPTATYNTATASYTEPPTYHPTPSYAPAPPYHNDCGD
ncbi:hypothetical protein ONS96_007051 [Cadophora gregata f. sp. sojae]|nr:hypothetical protein ONS96_007051 [Cadophora gregata f. sp. sojae]